MAFVGLLLAAVAAGSGVGQPARAKVIAVTTGPLAYTFDARGYLVTDEAALPGTQLGLTPVDPDAEPDASAAAFEVMLLDLDRPRGATDAVQEGPPIVLTPARLSYLRRRHVPALTEGFSEQAFSDLVADLVGLQTGTGIQDAPPGPGAKPGASAPTRYDLPQQRLLWELLKSASAPRLFVDFDGANRARVWGALSGRPAVPEATGQWAESANQRDLLAASAGVQGLVLMKRDDGSLVPPGQAVEVVITGTPGGQRKAWTVATNTAGYFCWPLPQDTTGRINVGIPDTEAVAEVTATPGSWSNVVIISEGPLPPGGPGTKGVGRGGAGACDAVGIVGALTGLLAGTAAGSIVPALSSSGLPLQTGVVWTPGKSARAYYGLERALEPTSFDRSPRSLGQANMVIEFWRYPLVGRSGQIRPGEGERAYRERAQVLCEAARARHWAARQAAEASAAELDRLTKIIREAQPDKDAAAYKALVEAQIALRKDDRERRSEAEARGAAYQAQLDLLDLCRARELQATGLRAPDAQETWTALCAGYNRYGQLPQRPTPDDVAMLQARIEQKLEDDSARAESLGPDARFEDPYREHLAYEGTPQKQDKLGYVRFLRVRLIATGVPTEALNIANRVKPGRWGLSAGMVAGEGGSQPAVGGWWLWHSLGLRLTVGSTFSSHDEPGELMLGCGVQVPLGVGSSSSGGSLSSGSGSSRSGSSTRASASTSEGGGGKAKAEAGGKGSGPGEGAGGRPGGGPPPGGTGKPPASGGGGSGEH